MGISFVHDERIFSCCFQNSFSVFDFWQFGYNVSQCRRLFHFLGPLDFMNLVASSFPKFGKFGSTIFLSFQLLSPAYPSGTSIQCISLHLRCLMRPLGFLYSFYSFCLSDWITSKDLCSGSLIHSSVWPSQILKLSIKFLVVFLSPRIYLFIFMPSLCL